MKTLGFILIFTSMFFGGFGAAIGNGTVAVIFFLSSLILGFYLVNISERASNNNITQNKGDNIESKIKNNINDNPSLSLNKNSEKIGKKQNSTRKSIIEYNQLVKEKGNLISYSDLLRTKEWINKRSKIIQRDNAQCQICGETETFWHYGNNITFVEEDTIVKIKHPVDFFEEEIIVPEMKVKIKERQYILHVHHKYYVLSKLPWEYQDEALITLCNWCHWGLHEREYIPVFVDSKEKLIEKKIKFMFKMQWCWDFSRI